MSILGWIVLGLIAGFIASKIVKGRGAGPIHDLILGVVGALVGGWVMTRLGEQGIEGFNLYSMLVATAGAIVLLVIFHLVRAIGRDV